MKLYLSSYRLGDNPQKLVDLVGKNKKAALIANAADYHSKNERDERVTEGLDSLRSLGFKPIEVDLRVYFGKPGKLAKKLTEFGLVWVRGGNVFLLRRAFSQSGFDKWLIHQKDNKDLIYGGYSAGICVLTPSLKGIEIVDDPNLLAPGYKPKIIWEGLGFFDYAIVPHYKSDHPESKSVDKVVAYYKKNKVKFVTLHDGEVIISEI